MSNTTTGPKMFTGKGEAGNWADPNNWGGDAPAAFNLDVIPVSTTEAGAFTARVLMMLGQETVTVNGALTTTSTNGCNSMMVCEGATAVFNATASLSDAGGLIVGNDGNGTLIANAANGARATLHANDVQIGKFDAAVGVMTLNGATLSSAAELLVGQQGQGTLDVTDGGSVSVGGFMLVAAEDGAAGTVALSGGSALSVAGSVRVGTMFPAGGTQGVGSVSVDATSRVSVGGSLTVGAASAINLGGGSLAIAGQGGLAIVQAGKLVGHGTVSAASMGLLDGGSIEAQGGTLALKTAGIIGNGTLRIDAGATAAVSATTIGTIDIVFAGGSAALDLAHGVACQADITGFAAGDSILMPGVDQIGWDSQHDLLTLSDQGHVVDTLHIGGSWGSADPFVITETSAGALITLSPHA